MNNKRKRKKKKRSSLQFTLVWKSWGWGAEQKQRVSDFGIWLALFFPEGGHRPRLKMPTVS
jgi:hypothetical protein